MKKFIVLKLTIVLLFAVAHSASAAYFNGSLLNKYCSSESKYEQGMCLGYVVGVVDSFNTTNPLQTSKRIICIPTAVTSGQLVLVIKKSMEEHPETFHLSASAHTLSALTAAFPCE